MNSCGRTCRTVVAVSIVTLAIATASILTSCAGGGSAPKITTSPAPIIASISPASGVTTGGTVVTITGQNFQTTGTTTVTFGGTAATAVTVSDSTTIKATAPAHAKGAVSVVVTNPDGQSATSPTNFTYNVPPPTISSISPTSGLTTGGTVVTITGLNFQTTGTTTVTFGGTAGTGVTVSSTTKISATTPAHAAGTVSVVVTNPDGQGATSPLNFTYTTSGGGGGPPASYTSRTDINTVQLPSPIPNVGNLVGANTVVTDPDFNNLIVRITDANTDPAKLNRSFQTTNSGSGDQNLWNMNSTFFVLGDDGGGMVPYSFDPSTMQATRLYVSSFPTTGGIRIGSVSGAWSHTNASLLYIKNLSGPEIDSLDFIDLTTPPSPLTVTVYNFATSSPNCLPSAFVGSGTTWGSDIGTSADDTAFGAAWSNTGGQDTGVYATVYKVGSGCRWYNTQTGQVGGDWGPAGSIVSATGTPMADSFSIHNARISKDGNWMVIDNAGCLNTSCTGPRYYWEVGTTTVTVCNQGNQCTGHFTEGYTHWVNDPNLMVTTIRLFSTPDTFSNLVSSNPTGLTTPWDTHQSWNNADAADGVPVFETTASATTPFPSAYYNEILAMAADGSGTVWRFAHSFITGPLTSNSYNFDAQYGIGSVSQDGLFFIFTSDWKSSLGSNSGGTTCTVGTDCRSDVFVVQLK